MKNIVVLTLVSSMLSALLVVSQACSQPETIPVPTQPALNPKEVEDVLLNLKRTLDEIDKEAKEREQAAKVQSEQVRRIEELRRRIARDAEEAFKVYLKAQAEAQSTLHPVETLQAQAKAQDAFRLLAVGAQPAEKAPPARHAVCVITPFGKSNVAGIVRFVQKGDTVEVTGEITGLTPGKHGFHVHEFGDISGKDGLTTGGHFNPDKMAHGPENAKVRHVGDLGNIDADKDGKAIIDKKDTLIRLSPGPHCIIGRAIIVHAKADDFSQPVGNAGARVAGGVIGIAK